MPCIAALPAGWSARAESGSHNGSARFWLDSDVPVATRVEVTLCGAATSAPCAARRRCRATSRGCAGSSRPAAASAEPAHATHLSSLTSECVTYRFAFDGDTNAAAHRRARQRARLPATWAAVDEVSPAIGSLAVRCRRAAVRRGRQVTAMIAAIAWRASSPAWSSARRARSLVTVRRPAPARHPPRVGHRARSPAGSVGASGILVALGLDRWDWGADGLVLHMLAIGMPATMAAAVALRPAGPARLAGDRRARRPRRRAPAVRAVRQRSPCSAATASWCAWRGARASARCSPAAGRAERSPRRQAVRLRRVLEAAGGVYIKLGQIAATRVDLLPGRRLRRARHAPEPGAHRSRVESDRRQCSRRSSVGPSTRCSPSSSGSRSPRHRSGRRTAPVCARARRWSSRSSDPASKTIIERDLAALALLADVAQRRTTFGRRAAVGRDARAVRPEPARRARLPTRGRRDDARWQLARRAPAPVCGCRASTASSARGGCSCRSASRVHRVRLARARRRRRSTASASGRGAAALDPRPGDDARVLPRRSAPGQRVRLRRRQPRPDRLRATGRLDPIQQAAVVDIIVRHGPA